MKTLIGEITKAISQIKNCQFVSLTYFSKSTKELSRYVINIGFSYHKLVEKSVLELEILMSETQDKTSIEYLGMVEVMASLQKTLLAHSLGQQNEDYTKAGQYVPLTNGLNLNSVDGTLQLFGLVVSKVVLVKGEYKKVNSKPLTIEKNRIRRELTIGKFREFALDKANIAGVKVNGETLEVLSPEGYGFTVNEAPKGWTEISAGNEVAVVGI